MKTAIIGDIHGRPVWKDIIEREKPDRTIFLGDYVSTHEGIGASQQLRNLDEILDYAEAGDCVLLRGNHDMQHLGYPWAKCSGWQPDVAFGMEKRKDRFLASTQWAAKIDVGGKPCILSHAGISLIWLHDSPAINPRQRGWVERLNALPPSPMFGFIPESWSDMDGSSPTQPPTWIRPFVLSVCMPAGYGQIVGHTPVAKGCFNLRAALGSAWQGGAEDLWLADGLAIKSYLVVENGKIEERKL
ncbi:MAG: metallophosphoesterase [Bacteroidales bacterium]|nr:metallophosphoesterase [Bacteroidales bacterium]